MTYSLCGFLFCFVFLKFCNWETLPHFLKSFNQGWFSEICKVLFFVHFTQTSFSALIHKYWSDFDASLFLELKSNALN